MKKLLLALPMAFLLSGCIIVSGDDDWDDDYRVSSSWRSDQNANRRAIAKLNLGESRKDVMETLGDPDFSEAYAGKDGTNYQILYYRTHRTHGDGQTTKDETTPLVFQKDKLIGWGNDAVQRLN